MIKAAANCFSMASQTVSTAALNATELADFHTALLKASRIVAVLGAGLSASSGLPTFRGAGGLWRKHDATAIATPGAFRRDPGLVWQFYSYRRGMALAAKPNAAHYALAELAQRRPGFLTLSQNVDNLSPRAGHPAEQLKLLHGNLFDLRCCNQVGCGFVEQSNLDHPLTPALAGDFSDEASKEVENPVNKVKASAMLAEGIAKKNQQILDAGSQAAAPPAAATAPGDEESDEDSDDESIQLYEESNLSAADLPKCPKCNGMMRPDVVWFGENLPSGVLRDVDDFFASPEPIDLCLVIGTSSRVWPAAGFAEEARSKGARVAVVNADTDDAKKNTRPGKDWVFVGDAATIVPELLRPVIGDSELW